eukprot:gene19258-biopygen20517
MSKPPLPCRGPISAGLRRRTPLPVSCAAVPSMATMARSTVGRWRGDTHWRVLTFIWGTRTFQAPGGVGQVEMPRKST